MTLSINTMLISEISGVVWGPTGIYAVNSPVETHISNNTKDKWIFTLFDTSF